MQMCFKLFLDLKLCLKSPSHLLNGIWRVSCSMDIERENFFAVKIIQTIFSLEFDFMFHNKRYT